MDDSREKRDELNSKVRELIDEKRALVEQIKALKTTVKEERDKRNKANDEVKELKQKRIASFDEIKKLKKEMDEILSVLDRMKGSVGGSYRELKEDLQAIDWEYQTGVHSIKKEKELVKQMDALEKEIARSEMLHDKKTKLIHLERKLRELYTEANVYHGLLVNRAKESEGHHDTMMKSLREIEKLERKIGPLEEKIEKTREDADRYHQEMKETTVVQPKQFEVTDEIRKKAEEILANFKAGKKVTMDDLALLQQLGLY